MNPASRLPAVPAMWRAWQTAAAIPPNVRLAISAGAPLPVNLEQEIFKTSGVKIHNFLGSSECGGIAYDACETPRADDAFVGSPMQNVHLSLNDDGCLVVRSRAVAETYWPEKSDSLGGGIFQTSDLAELKEGFVFLRGRLGDQINVAGRKLSPETVENALLMHSAGARMPCLWHSEPGCGTDGNHRCGRGFRCTGTRIESLSAANAACVAGAARMAFC